MRKPVPETFKDHTYETSTTPSEPWAGLSAS